MKKKIVALAVCVFALGLVAAQESDAQKNEDIVVLTVEQAVDYAMENSRTLKSNDIDLAIKERASKYSWNVFLPDVNLTGTAARSTDIESSIKPLRLNDEEKYHWALMANLNAQLTLSVAYIQQIRAAKASYEGGKITWEQSQKQTVMNIKKLFYGLLIQQENLKIQEESLANSKNRADQAAINYNNGRISQVQLLNAQVTYQNQIPEVETAKRNFNQQLDTFVFLIGMPVGKKVELSGSIEPKYVEVTTEMLLEKYGENNMDIRSLQSNIDVLRLNLSALNLGSYTPALVLGYNWNPTGSWLAGYGVGDMSGDIKWSDRGALSITLAWNLTNMLPFSKNRQQAQDVKDNLKKLELSMETLKENQKVQVRKAVDTLNQAREQIDSMGRTVELAQSSYNMSARMYNNGMMQLLDLRDAQTQLNQAKLGLLSQKFNYISALMDLEYELNTDLSEYIEK